MDYKENINTAIKFFKNHTKEYNDDEYVEIRLIGSVYIPSLFRDLLDSLNVNYLNKKQMFFNKKEHNKLKEVLSYDDYFLIKNYKICYTLNPRVWNNVVKFKRSGYEAMRDVRCIGFDFELKNHSNPTEEQLEGLRKYVYRVMMNISSYGLINAGIVHSGRGFHLIYYTFPQRITDNKKRWYKSLIEYLCEYYEDDEYRIDALKDFTRIFAIPGSINQKVYKVVQIIKLPKMCSFLIKNKEEDFHYVEREEDKVKDIDDLLEWKLLRTGKIPPGERHQLLVLPFKIWLYENNIPNWKEYETIINNLYGGAETFNPSQFRGASYKYNKGAVRKWLSKNSKWLKENNFEVL